MSIKKLFGKTLGYRKIAISFEEGCENQKQQLRKLLKKAQATSIGRDYSFVEMLHSNDPYPIFQRDVPLFDYDAIYNRYWHRSIADEPHITWPGYIPYFALSSGTSGASSKYVPVTHELINQIKKVSHQMFLELPKLKFGPKQMTKQILMIGSCTAPQQHGQHQFGDLSGILGMNRPVWMEPMYRPGRHITDLPDWGERIDAITKEAPTWDIGFVVGNPMWIQLVFERIIAHYQLNNIHEIWPNLKMITHSGVFFEPYRKGMEALLGKKVHFVDSYLASEGFIGLQSVKDTEGLRLLTRAGIFYEFVPFNSSNFDSDGNLLPSAKAIPLQSVENGQEYAIMLSTMAGAWRYLLGDTLCFIEKEALRFKITGRTKLGLSVCGEHISVDNLNMAVSAANEKLQAGIREFAVAGLHHGSKWQHRWWAAYDNESLTSMDLMAFLDKELCRLNDDYATERLYSLDKVELHRLPNALFHEWLSEKGKLNGQAKIPRVMKGETLQSWDAFLKNLVVAN